RGHGRAALRAVLEPHRLNRVMSPAATATGIRTLTFGDGHGLLASSGPQRQSRTAQGQTCQLVTPKWQTAHPKGCSPGVSSGGKAGSGSVWNRIFSDRLTALRKPTPQMPHEVDRSKADQKQ